MFVRAASEVISKVKARPLRIIVRYELKCGEVIVQEIDKDERHVQCG